MSSVANQSPFAGSLQFSTSQSSLDLQTHPPHHECPMQQSPRRHSTKRFVQPRPLVLGVNRQQLYESLEPRGKIMHHVTNCLNHTKFPMGWKEKNTTETSTLPICHKQNPLQPFPPQTPRPSRPVRPGCGDTSLLLPLEESLGLGAQLHRLHRLHLHRPRRRPVGGGAGAVGQCLFEVPGERVAPRLGWVYRWCLNLALGFTSKSNLRIDEKHPSTPLGILELGICIASLGRSREPMRWMAHQTSNC